MIYLDYAATNPVRPQVIDCIHQSLVDDYGNPSSIYQKGKQSKIKLMHARRQMADLLGVSSTDLYFTSGATEANNWALRHQAYEARKLGLGNHIVATAIEHPSVAEVLHTLSQDGFEITYIYPNRQGHFIPDDFHKATHSQTIGWVAMAVNNELGTILPIKELGNLAKELAIWCHVDAVQMIGHEDTSDLIDAATSFVGSAHKFGGPKGIGFLVYQPWNLKMTLKPLIYGGGQESKQRSGTENLPYILGMVEALKLSQIEKDQFRQESQLYKSTIIRELEAASIDFEINGPSQESVPYILNLWLKDINASQILIKLDLKEIYVSAGSACSAGSLTESPVLKAYYPDQPSRWQQSLRLSFGYGTQMADIKAFTQILIELLEGKS